MTAKSGRIQARRLRADEIPQLTALFALERLPEAARETWQDRPGFLDLYQHFVAKPPVYWGAFNEHDLLAASGNIPFAAHVPWRTIPLNDSTDTAAEVHLDTDLFAHPTRSSAVAMRALLEMRVRDWNENPEWRHPLTFGIEQIPRSLDVCVRIAHRRELQFRFPFMTRLQQIFLTQEPTPFAREPKSVEFQPLASATSSFRSQWLQRLAERATFLSPIVTSGILERIVALDPGALLIHDRDLSCGLCLISTSRARQIRVTHRTNLILEKLRRVRPDDLAPGMELKFALAGLCFGTTSSGFRDIVGAALRLAWDHGFHCLSIRDCPFEVAPSQTPAPKDAVTYERRVFLHYQNAAPFAAQLDHDLRESRLFIHLDPVFL